MQFSEDVQAEILTPNSIQNFDDLTYLQTAATTEKNTLELTRPWRFPVLLWVMSVLYSQKTAVGALNSCTLCWFQSRASYDVIRNTQLDALTPNFIQKCWRFNKDIKNCAFFLKLLICRRKKQGTRTDSAVRLLDEV